MIWRFSDGTTAELGGNIEGASLFAQLLRRELEHDRVGLDLYGGPGGGVWLDRNDSGQFDAWLKQEMGRPYLGDLRLRMTERPADIGELPPDPRPPLEADATV